MKRSNSHLKWISNAITRGLRTGLLCLLAMLPVSAFAQGSLYTYATERAVHLRWNAPLGEPYSGFHIERQNTAGGDWQRLTTTPVVPIADVAQIRALLGSAADSYLAFFADSRDRISAAEFQRVMADQVARGFIQLNSVKVPRIGYVLGELYQDRQLEPGSSFNYRVMILRGTTELLWAQSARATTHGQADQLPIPEGFRGEGGERSARLGWTHEPSRSKSGDVVSYQLYRAASPSGPFERATVDAVVPTRVDGSLPEFLYIDDDLENGQPYWFRVTAANVLGFESAPSPAIKIVPKDMTPPPPPQNFRGELRGEAAFFQWDPQALADLDGYRLYRSDSPSGEYVRVWPAADAVLVPRVSTTDADVPEGAEFWYFVAAVDFSGNESRPSDRLQIFRPDLTPPSQVQNLKAIAVDEGREIGVHLEWRDSDAEDLVGYIVQRTTRVSGKGADQVVEDSFFGENVEPLEQSAYIDPVPVASQSSYAYRVLAVDTAGNRSEPSAVVVARMPDKVPPTKPAIRYVRQEGNQIVVRWQANTEPDLAGYRVYRSADDRGYAPVNDTAVSVQELFDRPQEYEQVLFYRVTALDEAGNESEPSQALSVKYRDTEAPPAPDILAVEAMTGALKVVWAAADPAVETIAVYRSDGRGAEPRVIAYAAPGETELVDRAVVGDVEYTYFIRVTDERENLSEPGQPGLGRLDES